MKITAFLAFAFLSVPPLWADLQATAWNILTLTIDAGGPEADSALALLGSIQDPRARQLMEHILKGENDSAIEEVAQGLTPMEATTIFPNLGMQP